MFESLGWTSRPLPSLVLSDDCQCRPLQGRDAMTDSHPQRPGWPLPRHDAQNTGRSPLRGRMTSAPRERWRMSTGADVSFARAVPAADGDGIIVLAGSLLQRIGFDGGVRWRQGVLGTSFVQHVGDMDGTGTPCALVRTDARTLVLLEVATGEICWRWSAPAGTFVGDAAGLKVEPGPSGAALYVFPTYATEAWCFSFS